jgi:GNAT superfamily N-acetyltransferase
MPNLNYYGFHPAEDSGTVFGLERVADIEDELRLLHAEHFNETETLYLSEPFNPDYTRYKASEAANQFAVFTARVDSTLVGYLQYYVFRDMHSQGMYVAREDAFFVIKAHRGTGIASRLLSYAEDALKQLDCAYVGMSNKAPAGGPDIGRFLEARDYRPVATFFMKKLER